MTRPRISLNFAISADGRTTGVSGIASGWTSEADHQRLQALRQPAQALLVSRATLEADRMTMQAPHQPLRCVASKSGHFDPAHPFFQSAGGPIHLLGIDHPPTEVPQATTHHQSLAAFLESLYRDHKVEHLHCEGGGRLVHALAELDALDEIHLTWAGHKLFAGSGAPGITGPPGAFLPSSRAFELTHFEPRHDLGECFLSYRRKPDDQ